MVCGEEEDRNGAACPAAGKRETLLEVGARLSSMSSLRKRCWTGARLRQQRSSDVCRTGAPPH
ncbi:hypothetical protein E2C01_035101 [Portunus trituberculatus]|uniref:Uncharacterized protein n=1 Tax=Portunus trituberculatus TaxID=210409 RepID=A0A5B7F7J3_PORTR|nr:hypothetical protein [Portunus trituberculatus]